MRLVLKCAADFVVWLSTIKSNPLKCVSSFKMQQILLVIALDVMFFCFFVLWLVHISEEHQIAVLGWTGSRGLWG